MLKNRKRLLSRVKCLLLAVLLLLSTACGASTDTETPPAEESTPSVETEKGPVAEPTPEPEPEPEPEPKPEPEKPSYEKIQEIVNASGEKHGAVGIQVTVVDNGEIRDSYTYGWAKLDEIPMTVDHRIRCASISKVVLGIASMLMLEEGYIDLDTDISEYWGVEIKNDFKADKPITIRNLLNHTSSISNLDFTHSRDYESVKTMLTTAKGFSKKTPGSTGAYEYNNYAYDVLGMTLELASGKWVDDVLRERLFDAMGIQGGYFQDGLDASQIANVYSERDYVSLDAGTQASFLKGEAPGSDGSPYCGGLTISSRDLAKLVVLLANDGVYEGEQLMAPESVELLEAKGINTVTGYKQGLALRCRSDYGRRNLYFHPGDGYGTYTLFSYDAITKDGVVILTTGADNYGDFAVYGEIADYVYECIQDPQE